MHESSSHGSGGEGIVEAQLDLLENVLNYELACAERYRRFVSVVMVGSKSSEDKAVRHIAERVRSSDMMAESDASVVILMSETDKTGAKIAIDRFKIPNNDGADLSFSLVTYPYDSGGVGEMMETASRRLEMASNEGPGALVEAG